MCPRRLDRYRATPAVKCEGPDDEQAAVASVPCGPALSVPTDAFTSFTPGQMPWSGARAPLVCSGP